MTYDIDIMIEFTEENVLKILKQLNEWGYKPKAPVDPEHFIDAKTRETWIKEKGMKAFNFYNDEFRG